MNDAFRFAVPCSSTKELITRLQFGTTDLWTECTDLPARWQYMADLIVSDRGMLAELNAAVSTPVADVLAATAELCRQSASEPVPMSDWELLRRALAWLERSSSDVDGALLAVAEEMTLIGLDGAEQDFSVATWLCIEVFDRFAATGVGETIGYWLQRVAVPEPTTAHHHVDAGAICCGRSEVSVGV
ncbi:putative uncharacterized protein [Rhodococcus sp. AW25M09]|uniref:hypothetical protein n=1 Tax=Rhodococcus sp. AW25M09 TaxID=1268303 RepID=UPI0002ABBBE2|nr:hypothetical protein [Rhodococcus sp. AW25M09]CCQ14943.1 putative uncharacterized protein [Rhodococcus sp. AW25M09]